VLTRILLTGAGGFIGHHLLEHLLVNTDWEIIATDSFRHKGLTDRIRQVLDVNPSERDRVRVVTHDLTVPFSTQLRMNIGDVDHVIAMASESHVARSIDDPVPFVENNVSVILNTLEFARLRLTNPDGKFLVVSSDEVYGPVKEIEHAHKEWAPLIPSNPYAASKAAQEAIAISYWRTYGVPVVLTNMMNTIGERQDVEKFVPKTIKAVLEQQPMTIHGSLGHIGTRHYLHARNSSDAWLFLLRQGRVPRFPDADSPPRFNIASNDVIDNLELAEHIAEIIGEPLQYELVDFHSARPGHDPHYGLDPAKLASLGWNPPIDFDTSLEKTVLWTMKHPEWLE
jgi:dTDP-glucose 4,6-dehydratase